MTKHRFLPKRLGASSTAFANDESGVTAVIFALTLFPALLTIGVGVDYARIIEARARLQTAVDQAALAAVQLPPEARGAFANARLAENVAGASLANVVGTWTNNADGTMTATAHATMSPSIVGFAGLSIGNLKTTSTVTFERQVMAPTSATFEFDSAKGWYWKRVSVVKHIAGAAQETVLAQFIYKPNRLNGPGSGPVTGPLAQSIDFGTDYDYAYIMMEVKTDPCAPGEKMTGVTRYNQPVCAVKTNSDEKDDIYSFKSNDLATAKQVFIDGVQLSTRNPSNVLDFMKCNQTVKQAWEDQRAWDTGDTRDLVFRVTTSTCAGNTNIKPTTSRIVK